MQDSLNWLNSFNDSMSESFIWPGLDYYFMSDYGSSSEHDSIWWIIGLNSIFNLIWATCGDHNPVLYIISISNNDNHSDSYSKTKSSSKANYYNTITNSLSGINIIKLNNNTIFISYSNINSVTFTS